MPILCHDSSWPKFTTWLEKKFNKARLARQGPWKWQTLLMTGTHNETYLPGSNHSFEHWVSLLSSFWSFIFLGDNLHTRNPGRPRNPIYLGAFCLCPHDSRAEKYTVFLTLLVDSNPIPSEQFSQWQLWLLEWWTRPLDHRKDSEDGPDWSRAGFSPGELWACSVTAGITQTTK
jgi:hypothetical protein